MGTRESLVGRLTDKCPNVFGLTDRLPNRSANIFGAQHFQYPIDTTSVNVILAARIAHYCYATDSQYVMTETSIKLGRGERLLETTTDLT